MKRVFAGIVAISALLMAGCGSNALPDSASGGTPKPPSPLAAFLGTWTTKTDGRMITLTIQETGAFTLSGHDVSGKPDKHLAAGTVAVQDGVLLLTATEVDGKPPVRAIDKEPEKMKLSADGTTLLAGDGTKLTKA